MHNQSTTISNSALYSEDSKSDLTITKQTFLNPDKYNLLKSYQQKVYERTEVSPTLRKLVNALITEKNLDIVIEKIIDALTY